MKHLKFKERRKDKQMKSSQSSISETQLPSTLIISRRSERIQELSKLQQQLVGRETD